MNHFMPTPALTAIPSPTHLDPTHPEHPRRLDGLATAAGEAFGDSLLLVESRPASEEASPPSRSRSRALWSDRRLYAISLVQASPREPARLVP
jgi:hypothetical protein